MNHVQLVQYDEKSTYSPFLYARRGRVKLRRVLSLSVRLSVHLLFVSPPYLLKPLKNYFETWAKYSHCRDDVHISTLSDKGQGYT